MKIAMLGWEFPPFMAGGLGVHCLELTLGLAREGVHIDFYMPRVATRDGPLRISERYDHIDIHEVAADTEMGPYGRQVETYSTDFNASVMRYNERLVEEFDTFDADIIHCHDWITVPAGLELKRRTGKPLVYTVHSTEYDRSAGLFPQHWIEDIERTGIHTADCVIAVSRYTKGILEKHFGADPDRVVPIHNGIDGTRFRPASQRDYERARGTVLFLSRLSRQKGPLFFLEAARQVLQRRPETGFVVAGQGDMLGECIDFTLAHGIADRVRFAGYVPDSELPDVLAENEVYVLPSVSEPFGISALEAMSTGLPTIVTKTSGVGEDMHHVLKSDYWDVEGMADMILHLLDSPELRQELGQNGSRETLRFTWTSSARQTLDAYRSVIPTEVNT